MMITENMTTTKNNPRGSFKALFPRVNPIVVRYLKGQVASISSKSATIFFSNYCCVKQGGGWFGQVLSPGHICAIQHALELAVQWKVESRSVAQ